MRYALLFVAAMVLAIVSAIILTRDSSAVSPVEASEDALWSKPDNGLQARLLVLPSEKPDSPFCRVYLEFQNVSDVAGQKKIKFSPNNLTLAVADKNGRKLAGNSGVYDGMSPLWEPMLLPYDGTLKFRISFPGLGYRPGKDKVIIDVGVPNTWIIPQDGSIYYLSGAVSIKREIGDHPHMDWNGTLTLPRVEIPQPKVKDAKTSAATATAK
jgi:hypothetical protein